jgi:hypothetical protein
LIRRFAAAARVGRTNGEQAGQRRDRRHRRACQLVEHPGQAGGEDRYQPRGEGHRPHTVRPSARGRSNDLHLLRRAAELRRRGERTGGRLAAHLPNHGLAKQELERWISYAEMSADDFEVSLTKALKRQSINGHFGTLCSGIKMQITPWFIDAGVPTRILRAVD